MAKFAVLNSAKQRLAYFFPLDAEEKLVLNGFNELDITVPKTYVDFITGGTFSLSEHFQERNIIEVVDTTTKRYRIQKRQDVLGKIRLSCLSLEIELTDEYTNEVGGGSEFFGHKPSTVANTILSGKRLLKIKNPSFGVLDGDSLPINWTRPTSWASVIVGGKRAYYVGANGVAASDRVRITPFLKYRAKVTGYSGGTTSQFLWMYFLDSSGAAIGGPHATSILANAPENSLTTGDIAAPYNAYWLMVEIRATSYNAAGIFSNVEVKEEGAASAWTYFAIVDGSGNSMDARAEIKSNDSLVAYYPGISRYGSVTSGYWNGLDDSTPLAKSSAVGNKFVWLGFTPSISIYFKGSQVSNSAVKITIDGVVKQASFSVVNDATYTLTGLDLHTHHIIEVAVAAGTVHFWKMGASTENLFHTRFDFDTRLKAIYSLRELGGDLEFDSSNLHINHYLSMGQDRTVVGGADFRKGKNIEVFELEKDAADICNRLIYQGYGDGDYMLTVTVDADIRRSTDNKLSQEVYGIIKGTHQNKDVFDLATARKEARLIVNENAFPKETYEIRVYDVSEYGAFSIGDWVKFTYEDVQKKLRILEIKRDLLKPQKVNLVVSNRAKDLTDTIAQLEKDLETSNKSPAGAPQENNMWFEKEFDQTYPAKIRFYLQSGSILDELRLNYSVSGMESTTKSVASGGGSTPTSGASSASSSGASSASSSGDGGSYTASISTNTTGVSDHSHNVATRVSGAAIATQYNRWVTTTGDVQTYDDVNHGVGATINTYGGGNHSHPMNHSHSIPNHNHGISHTHGIAHTHDVTIPSHDHGQTYGIEKSAAPSGVTAYLDDVQVSTSLAAADLDILQFIKKDSTGKPLEGWHEIKFTVNQTADKGHVEGTLFYSKFIYTKLS